MGRLLRWPGRRPRCKDSSPRILDNFYNRVGFTEAATEAFDELWSGSTLSNTDIAAKVGELGPDVPGQMTSRVRTGSRQLRRATAHSGICFDRSLQARSCIETPSNRSISGDSVSRGVPALAISTISGLSKWALWGTTESHFLHDCDSVLARGRGHQIDVAATRLASAPHNIRGQNVQ